MSAPQKVSFTNLTAALLSSPLARSATSSPRPKDKPVAYYDDKDSSDEDDDGVQDELVTGFDRFGVQRLKPRKKPEGPLIIPALKNRDWREVARKRRTATQFVPASGAAQTGADGSVGGLGTRDTINSGPVLVGLQVRTKVADNDTVMSDIKEEETTEVKMEEEQETEDQKALRAILAGVNGNNNGEPAIDIIPTPVSEEDALKQDVADLPDSATLTDYERVPVSQFGAALLRGMGWKEGTAASKKGKGMVEPYLPEARPALLGIGAKEKEALDDGRPKKGGSKRPEKRYVPVVRKEREGGRRDAEADSYGRNGTKDRSDSSRGSGSRRNSRSPGRRSERRDHDDRTAYDERRSSRHRDYDRDRDHDGRRRLDKDRDRRRDRSSDSSRRRRD
ncbi:SPP2 family protein [Pleurotus pulmonarius]